MADWATGFNYRYETAAAIPRIGYFIYGYQPAIVCKFRDVHICTTDKNQ